MLSLPSFADCIYDPTFTDLLHDKIVNEHNQDDLRDNDLLVSFIYYKLDYDKLIKNFFKLYFADLNRYIKEKTGFNCNLKMSKFHKNEKYIFVELKDKHLRKRNIKKIDADAEFYDVLQKFCDEYNTSADIAVMFDNVDLVYKKNIAIDCIRSSVEYKTSQDAKKEEIAKYVDFLK